MTATQTASVVTPEPAAAAAGTERAAGASVRTMAISLWGVVGALLAYGVLQTAIKASALFTG